MRKHSENRGVKVMGIDLAKSSFHVHGEDADGRKEISKKFLGPSVKTVGKLPEPELAHSFY